MRDRSIGIRNGLTCAIVVALAPVGVGARIVPRPDAEPVLPYASAQDSPSSGRSDRTSVTGAVEAVLGPRLFRVAPWDGSETRLVYVPPPGLALVRDGVSVAITGAIRPAASNVIAHEWYRFGDNADVNSFRTDRTILVADRLTSEGTNIDLTEARDALASERTGQPETAPALTDLETLAASTDEQLVGRSVDLRNARITAIVSGGGFWVSAGGKQLFVLPGDETHLRQDQLVNFRGVVLELPRGAQNRLGDYTASRDEVIYVYATQVRVL
jgi:hypothetical protein